MREIILRNFVKYSPSFGRKLLYSFFPKFTNNSKISELLYRMQTEPGFYNMGSSYSFFDSQIKDLIIDRTENNSIEYEKDIFIKLGIPLNNKEEDILNQYTFFEMYFRIPELLLMRVDKMMMANSIEGRAPFLDKELVEFAVSLPMKYKIRDKEGKYILKKVMEKFLPKEILYRPKMGFCGSSANMLNDDIYKYAFDILAEKETLSGIINTNVIKELFSQFKSGKSGNSIRIWTLLNLALWYKTWFK
jgi:asparagine synthase (glutamine-hydrolysing)